MPAAEIERIEAALRGEGWVESSGLFPRELLLALAREAGAHLHAGHLQAASTGRGSGRRDSGLRGDGTLWLDDARAGEAAQGLLAALDGLRVALNRRLLLGLDEVEAHFAHYPPGAGYARHRDRFRSDDARVLSLVLYLNDGWPADGGGELRLHLPGGARDITPRLGTTVMFMSDEVEHEVLPARLPRFSVAAWFRQRPRVG